MQRLSLLLLAICVSRGQGQTQHPPEFGGGLDGSAGSSSVVGTPDVSINQFDVTDKTKRDPEAQHRRCLCYCPST